MILPGTNVLLGTQKPAVYLTRVGKRKVFLLDTPGFDDSARDNLEVLSEIMSQLYLLALQPDDFSMQGVVFLHDMNEVRFGGSQKKTLSILKALVGEEHLGNVVIGSTFWDNSKLQQQEQRERELTDQHWGGIYKTMRLPHNDKGAAVAIINELFTRAPALLLAQEEILKPPHTVEMTTVGKLAVPEGRLELENLQREREERERAFEVETKRQEALLREQIRDTRQKFKVQEAQSQEREKSQMLKQADEMKKLEKKLRREFENENKSSKEEVRRENRKREIEERAIMKLEEDLRKKLVKRNKVREEKARRDAEEEEKIKITLKNSQEPPKLTLYERFLREIVAWFDRLVGRGV